MKKLTLATWLALGSLSAFAGGAACYQTAGCAAGTSIAFSYGVSAYPSSCPSAYYSYSYSPNYAYPYGPVTTRPNYAVGGTMLGALAGGLIGNSIDHQGWEGAGIGAAAGLVLGSIAEQTAQARERASFPPPVLVRVRPAPAKSASSAPAPRRTSAASQPAYLPAASDPMSSANQLFGR